MEELNNPILLSWSIKFTRWCFIGHVHPSHIIVFSYSAHVFIWSRVFIFFTLHIKILITNLVWLLVSLGIRLLNGFNHGLKVEGVCHIWRSEIVMDEHSNWRTWFYRPGPYVIKKTYHWLPHTPSPIQKWINGPLQCWFLPPSLMGWPFSVFPFSLTFMGSSSLTPDELAPTQSSSLWACSLR